MLFEFAIAKKYLIPQKKQLSMSLIALMSIGVISLVVWLVLVFLSVTDGIEKNWLKKLTAFNAPIRITPTNNYYNSYYYQIDGVSSSSDFSFKSIREKALASLTNPYNEQEDLEIPYYFPDKVVNPDGSLKDLVKTVFSSVESLKEQEKSLIAEDYEVSGALLKLRLIRPKGERFAADLDKNQGYLTQASYISSFSGKSPFLHSLLEPPRVEDLNHLLFLASIRASEVTIDQPEKIGTVSFEEFQKNIQSILSHITITKMKSTSPKWSFSPHLLPEKINFHAIGHKKNGKLTHFSLPESPPKEKNESSECIYGILSRENEKVIFTSNKGDPSVVTLPVYSDEVISMKAHLIASSLSSASSLQDLAFEVSFQIQGKSLQGIIHWKGIEIEAADPKVLFTEMPKNPPIWPFLLQEVGKETIAILPESFESETGVVLPKNFQVNGVKIGDRGYFSYNASTTSSIQEQRLPIYVSGFYDPGVMAIGSKSILTSSELIHDINTSSQSFSFDQNMINGIQVWFKEIDQAKEIQKKITQIFEKEGILPYFSVASFYEYDFARDLLQQFQSDKYLFTMIGAIVLIVACSNIISLLVILVNDKKREIAVLRAMGTSKKTIAIIFTLCGGIMGGVSTLIGTFGAILTLHNIDSVVHFLSYIQGHDAFNAVFYGKSLPSELSHHALIFILIATPIMSLLAGLVPAIKACKLHPSSILRSD